MRDSNQTFESTTGSFLNTFFCINLGSNAGLRLRHKHKRRGREQESVGQRGLVACAWTLTEEYLHAK